MINSMHLQRIVHGSGHSADCFRLSGIYAIENTVNGHCYVGSSCRVLVRGRKHLADLIAGNHHCEPLQRAFKKYGIGSFTLGVLEVVEDRGKLQDAEQLWIDTKGYYNTAKSAKSPAGVKLQLSAEERARRRELAIRLNAARNADETKSNLSKATAARLSAPTSIATREKISRSLKGRQFTEEHLEKIKTAKANNPENTRNGVEAAKRLNEARRNMTPEQVASWKQKLRDAKLGKKLTDEHRAKIKAGMAAANS